MNDELIVQQSKIISLNSRFATEKQNNNKLSRVLFDFNNIATRDKNVLYHTITIQSAEIPASYYNCSDHNNKLSVSISGGSQGNVSSVITIPVGNYNASNFITRIKQSFVDSLTTNVNMVFNEIFGTYTLYSQDANETITIHIDGTTCKKLLGIPSIHTDNITLTNTDNTLPIPASFLGILKIKVSSNSLSGENVDSKRLKTSTLIDTISTSGTTGGITIYNSLGKETYVKGRRIDEIDLQLRDEDDELIDFNGVDWTLTINLNTYKKQRFSTQDDIIRNNEPSIKEQEEEKKDTDELIKKMDFDILMD